MSGFGWLGRLVARVDAFLQPARATTAWRAYTRYSWVRGNVLAGGVAYFAFFSLFPALALGFIAFALVLGNQQGLQVQVVQYVNSNLGATVVGYKNGQGLVDITSLTRPGLLATTGLVGAVTLFLTGLGWIAALRDGVQAVFGTRTDTNFVVVKLFDVVLFAVAGLAGLASVVANVAVDVATGQVVQALGIPSGVVSEWTVFGIGQVSLVAVDAVIFTLVIHRLAGADVPVADAAIGGLVAALGFTVLKLFAGELLQTASRNRFLAASGLLLGLLVWMNLVARLALLSAALSATVAADRGHLPALEEASNGQRPDEDPSAAGPAEAPGARRTARLLLGAGFVAGALSGVLAGALRPRRR